MFVSILLCLAIFAGSYCAGVLPLHLKISDKHVRLLSAFGAGLLVGVGPLNIYQGNNNVKLLTS